MRTHRCCHMFCQAEDNETLCWVSSHTKDTGREGSLTKDTRRRGSRNYLKENRMWKFPGKLVLAQRHFIRFLKTSSLIHFMSTMETKLNVFPAEWACKEDLKIRGKTVRQVKLLLQPACCLRGLAYLYHWPPHPQTCFLLFKQSPWLDFSLGAVCKVMILIFIYSGPWLMDINLC